MENSQCVYFTEDTGLDCASWDPPKTTLTEFFALCQVDGFARTLRGCSQVLYVEQRVLEQEEIRDRCGCFPGVRKTHVLGKVYTINPRQGECFYLRLLLHHIRGPQSFAELKIVEGNLCSSFHEACFRLGLFEDDSQYHLAMQEASVSNSASSFCSLFALIDLQGYIAEK